ncbi:MAG: hypothetical protein JXA91_03060 [Candidatus Thermoplasmatota archaeon]|nr:hypothetical protein [Candidatus Thermoplasmatota archaeon]
MSFNESKIEKIINKYKEKEIEESNITKGGNRPDLTCQVTIFGNFKQEIIEVKAKPKKEIVEIHTENYNKPSRNIFKRFILKSKNNY